MKEAQIIYLQKAIKTALELKSDAIAGTLASVQCPGLPVYQLMKDLVCDIRFYSVTGTDIFWTEYAAATIARFIDMIPDDKWEDTEHLATMREDFLQNWFLRHLLPLTRSEREEIIKKFNLEIQGNGKRKKKKRGSGGKYVEDMTAEDIEMGDNLPLCMKPFLKQPGLEGEEYNAEAEFLRAIDPTLVKLAKEIGRCGGGDPKDARGKFQSAARSDISGVTVGNDLNSVLPTEIALLSDRQTQDVFLHRYVQKRLQIFSSASRSFEKGDDKTGPIFLCIDTSSSMSGKPEVMAKTLAMAVAILVQKDRRPVCLINYSHKVSFFVLTDLRKQKQDFIRFLSHSYSGGNDENKLFSFIFESMPEMTGYRRFAKAFKNADLLIISDFFWGSISDRMSELLSEAREGGMEFYGLRIQNYDMEEMRHFFVEPDEDTPMSEYHRTGFEFFKNCDHRYVFQHNRVRKVREKTKGKKARR